MYVCMYVCKYVCKYVCIYVCMYVCTYVCMYVCMHVCTYVCILPAILFYVAHFECDLSHKGYDLCAYDCKYNRVESPVFCFFLDFLEA